MSFKFVCFDGRQRCITCANKSDFFSIGCCHVNLTSGALQSGGVCPQAEAHGLEGHDNEAIKEGFM